MAEELFAELGFENTSMEDIARSAGVTRPIVYSHYATKEGIFLACVRRARRNLEDRLGELDVMLDNNASVTEVIQRSGEIFFETLEQDPRRWSVLFSPRTALSEDVTAQLRQLRFGTIDRIIQIARHMAGQEDADRISAYSHAISGVGEQLGRWWLANPTVRREQIVSYYREFIMRGLAPLEA